MLGMSFKLASLLFLCFAFGSIHSVNADYSDNTIQDDENHYSRNLLITAPVATRISQRANNNDKAVALKLETEFNNWLAKPAGQEAVKFCKEFENRPDIYQGCLEDIKVTGSKEIAKQGALAEEKFRSKSKMSTSRKFCVASGDPHFTNYDGDYFHLQEKGIFTLMRSNDFEVQEKVRKNGADKAGVPSCLTGLAVRYNGLVTLEVDAENVKKIVVNGVSMDLPTDFTMKFGGLEVRYGSQNIEWRGSSSKTTGTKIVAPSGFGVMVMGGYCGVVEINAPEKYFNKVYGICGNADGNKDTNDYKNPDGTVMNVNRGTRNWGMSGYDGPTSPLSKWQLSWKPLGSACFFQSGCEPAPAPAVKVMVTPAVNVVTTKASPNPTPVAKPAPTPVAKPAPTPSVKVLVTPTVSAPTSKSSASSASAWATSSSASGWSSSSSVSSASKSPSSKSSSHAHTNNTHHLNLRTSHHNDLIKNLKFVKTVTNHTTACVADYLYVTYDGHGSIFIAGADKNQKVHKNRKDCLGNTEGLQKVVQFNTNDVTYFSIDVESSFEGHLDCGGSAFWNAQKSREFSQKCSWNSFGSKTPTIVTTVTLYTTPPAVEKVEERLSNDLMGQWYLLGERKADSKLRQCLVATIFRHDSNFFMKHSVNIGKQTFSIKDHPIESFAIDTQLFKMDGQVYAYKISQFKHANGAIEHILLLKNTKDASDERVFGDKVYTKTVVDKLVKDKYTGLSSIDQKCYTD